MHCFVGIDKHSFKCPTWSSVFEMSGPFGFDTNNVVLPEIIYTSPDLVQQGRKSSEYGLIFAITNQFLFKWLYYTLYHTCPWWIAAGLHVRDRADYLIVEDGDCLKTTT